MVARSPERLRILFVLSRLEEKWCGGIGRVTSASARALAKRGHSVHVAGRAPKNGTVGEIPGVAAPTTSQWCATATPAETSEPSLGGRGALPFGSAPRRHDRVSAPGPTSRGKPPEGKDMLTARRGINIDDAEFIAAIDDAMAALEKNGVGQLEREEVLFILYSLKKEVVHV